jgi:hypothetical protein
VFRVLSKSVRKGLKMYRSDFGSLRPTSPRATDGRTSRSVEQQLVTT